MTLPLEEDPRPPYIQAAEILRADILEDRLRPGDKLPSARALQQRYGISSSTIQSALRVLKDEGLVYSVQGRGSYVRARDPHDATYRQDAILEELKEISDRAREDRRKEAAEHTDQDDPAALDEALPPLTQAINAIRTAILEGRLKSGDKVPDAIRLQLLFSGDPEVVDQELRSLKSEGLIHPNPRGYTVALITGGRHQFQRKMLADARAESLRRAAQRAGESEPSDEADITELEEDPRPPYIQLAETLRTEILDGRLPPGRQLPPARALQERFGVASSTVQNALRALKTEGLIYSVLGRGSYVRKGIERPKAAERTAHVSDAELTEQLRQLNATIEGAQAQARELEAELERRQRSRSAGR
ncbi:GntR family transcriptional regulator [Kitasatospora purpeofusca]|uniref:GntR family transcriptional regulator n=1 Tax=Kitasatospora purpeofusca TaxID=67352 RepID=UPI0038639476|nr:GntR family transcriptional regulator [Kitasatospora purpeofusca]